MAIINISPEEPNDEAFQNIETILGEKASEATLQQVKTELAGVKQSTADTNGKIGTKEDSATATTIFGKLKSIGDSLAAHMARWSSARASKIDRLDSLDTTISSRAPSNTALSTATWTAARASAIDTINTNAANASTRAESARAAAVNAQNSTAINNTANKTGLLSQKMTYTHNLLENTTYGLSATKTAIDTINTNAANASTRAESARAAAVNAQNSTAINNTANKTGLLSQKMTYTHNLLESGTYGLNAIKNVVNTINTNTARGMVKRIQRGVALIDQSTTTSEEQHCFLHVNIIRTDSMEKVFASVGMPSEQNDKWGLINTKQGVTAAVVLVDEWTIRIATTYNNGISLYVPWQVVEYY